VPRGLKGISKANRTQGEHDDRSSEGRNSELSGIFDGFSGIVKTFQPLSR
jgi:hypothetical protein